MPLVHVLGNPNTTATRDVLNDVVSIIRSAGDQVHVIDAPTVEAAQSATRQAVADGASRLIAVGGDGIVHLAVNEVAGTDTVLGIVAQGTGNDFARALGLLDGDVTARIGRALAEPAAVDAISTNHGWVASVATLGFSGDVTDRANQLRWPRGQMRYTIATLLQLPRLRTYAVDVRVDGRHLEDSTTLLAVGNTAFFGGGMQICPGVGPADGALQVVSVADLSRLRFARNFSAVFSGKHVLRDEVTAAVGSVVEIDGPSDIEMWADGEPLGPLPIRLETVAGALNIAGATT